MAGRSDRSCQELWSGAGRARATAANGESPGEACREAGLEEIRGERRL